MAVSPNATRVPDQSRTMFLHVGTHKTGSTALQYFLTHNRAALAAAGVYVPKTGRLASHPQGCGHHNVAFELTESVRYHEPLGSFADLLAEIAGCGMSRICISSEEFENLHHKPANLRLLRGELAAIGFRTKVIVYLRPQVDYLESLYAELVKSAWFFDFSTCLQNVLTHGTLSPGSVAFAYERLVNAFADVFGIENVIVRPYRRDQSPDLIQREFAQIIGLSEREAQCCIFAKTERINERLTFGATIAALRAASHGRPFDPDTDAVPADIEQHVGSLDGPFDPIQPREAIAIIRRFGGQNLRLSLRYRVALGCISRGRLAGMLQSRLHPKGAQSKRRRLLDAMFARMRERRRALEAQRAAEHSGSHWAGGNASS